MNQLDIKIKRYEERLFSAVKNNLPEAIIQQYNSFLGQKLSEKKQEKTKINNIH
ncbi:MAG: hypothetical protein OQL19_04675 [Gammaproteobacteria bacterium]|nr:hypothetical protein [Gammaproteobacteria bacterium]